MKKTLALVMALAMLISLLPAIALTAGAEDSAYVLAHRGRALIGRLDQHRAEKVPEPVFISDMDSVIRVRRHDRTV